jgi:hypothetical protein
VSLTVGICFTNSTNCLTIIFYCVARFYSTFKQILIVDWSWMELWRNILSNYILVCKFGRIYQIISSFKSICLAVSYREIHMIPTQMKGMVFFERIISIFIKKLQQKEACKIVQNKNQEGSNYEI